MEVSFFTFCVVAKEPSLQWSEFLKISPLEENDVFKKVAINFIYEYVTELNNFND